MNDVNPFLIIDYITYNVTGTTAMTPGHDFK